MHPLTELVGTPNTAQAIGILWNMAALFVTWRAGWS